MPGGWLFHGNGIILQLCTDRTDHLKYPMRKDRPQTAHLPGCCRFWQTWSDHCTRSVIMTFSARSLILCRSCSLSSSSSAPAPSDGTLNGHGKQPVTLLHQKAFRTCTDEIPVAVPVQHTHGSFISSAQGIEYFDRFQTGIFPRNSWQKFSSYTSPFMMCRRIASTLLRYADRGHDRMHLHGTGLIR